MLNSTTAGTLVYFAISELRGIEGLLRYSIVSESQQEQYLYGMFYLISQNVIKAKSNTKSALGKYIWKESFE